MNIHSAIKFGAKNNIKVSPSHEVTVDAVAAENQDKHESKQPTPATEQTVKESTKEVQINQPQAKQADLKQKNISPDEKKPSQKPEEKSAFRLVDLSIAGTSHRITCPADEVVQLEQAGAHINDKIRELRRAIKGKNPTNEELLVLVCLELHDQCQSLKSERERQLLDNERAQVLIDKITKDARSVL